MPVKQARNSILEKMFRLKPETYRQLSKFQALTRVWVNLHAHRPEMREDSSKIVQKKVQRKEEVEKEGNNKSDNPKTAVKQPNKQRAPIKNQSHNSYHIPDLSNIHKLIFIVRAILPVIVK